MSTIDLDTLIHQTKQRAPIGFEKKVWAKIHQQKTHMQKQHPFLYTAIKAAAIVVLVLGYSWAGYRMSTQLSVNQDENDYLYAGANLESQYLIIQEDTRP